MFHKLQFLQKLSRQKLFWDVARLSSLVNKLFALQTVSSLSDLFILTVSHPLSPLPLRPCQAITVRYNATRHNLIIFMGLGQCTSERVSKLHRWFKI